MLLQRFSRRQYFDPGMLTQYLWSATLKSNCLTLQNSMFLSMGPLLPFEDFGVCNTKIDATFWLKCHLRSLSHVAGTPKRTNLLTNGMAPGEAELPLLVDFRKFILMLICLYAYITNSSSCGKGLSVGMCWWVNFEGAAFVFVFLIDSLPIRTTFASWAYREPMGRDRQLVLATKRGILRRTFLYSGSVNIG